MRRRAADIFNGLGTLAGLASGRWVFTGPRTVALIVADECNSSCVMCWYHSPLLDGNRSGTHSLESGVTRPRFMDRDLFESIVRQCRDLGTRRIVLGGSGETALHPDLDAMLEFIVAQGIRPYVITNGLAVDAARARRWASLPAHFRFSLHAGDLATWLVVHPAGTPEQFDQICSAVSTLAASKSASVSLMHVIQRANFRTVSTMVRHARSLGVGELVLLPVRAEGAVAAEVVLEEEEEVELSDILKEAQRLARQWGIRTTLGDYLTDRRHVHAGRLATAEVYHEIPCNVGWTYAEIDIDGSLRPCEGSRAIMGKVTNTSIATMWRSDAYGEFRRAARDLPRRRTPVFACPCDACCMVKFNRNIRDLLRLRSLRPSAP